MIKCQFVECASSREAETAQRRMPAISRAFYRCSHAFNGSFERHTLSLWRLMI